MAKIYAELVHKGLRTIESVPKNLVSEVKLILAENGWEYDGETAPLKTSKKTRKSTKKSGPPDSCPNCGAKGSTSIEWNPNTDISVCQKCGWTNKQD